MEPDSPYRPPLTVEEVRPEPPAPRRVRWLGISHLVMAAALLGVSVPLLVSLSGESEPDPEKNLNRVHFILGEGVAIFVMVLLLIVSGCYLVANRKRGIKWSNPLGFFGVMPSVCFSAFNGFWFLHGKMGPLPVIGPFIPLIYAVVAASVLGSPRVRDWVSPPRATDPGLGKRPWVKWVKD
ncbi:MAG: hypothetical protein JWO82_538 [Akkermansiaceae bacterium]|nr:hypothetical protein [Akkermansiaceae bacterium]